MYLKLMIYNLKIFSLTLFFIFKYNLALSENKPIYIFAPASLNMALKKIIDDYENKNKISITTVYLGTSQLVKQIENGANPDIFISANKDWMDYVQKKKYIID